MKQIFLNQKTGIGETGRVLRIKPDLRNLLDISDTPDLLEVHPDHQAVLPGHPRTQQVHPIRCTVPVLLRTADHRIHTLAGRLILQVRQMDHQAAPHTEDR